ncbi:MAG: RNase adapter RapZ [Endomicrobia bacterium]|nr:RNase adapter RapZ [Endomicrobiia bacterium]
MKKLIIISGLSGAGKSQVLNILEDNEYFCVDNLPVELFDKFTQLAKIHREKFAVSMDVRSVVHIQDLVKIYKGSIDKFKDLEVLKIFLSADIKVLVNRFSETRRKHPLGGELISAIKKEQKLLEEIKKLSDVIIDTSNLTIWELKQKVLSIVEKRTPYELKVNIISFAYKLGLPMNADVVFDTRFLPNPNYVDKLKNLNGQSSKVKKYVLGSPLTMQFLTRLKDMLKFLLPQVISEGKSYFTIAFGCTGGQHRSVVIAEEIYKFLLCLKKQNDIKFSINLQHRDVSK